MNNRRINVSIRKVVQENQYEPFEICLGIEGDIFDSSDLEKEYNEAYRELELIIEQKINERLGIKE